jgi:hypothetical protein
MKCFRRLMMAGIAVGVLMGSTVWFAVPTQAPTGNWTIAYPLPGDDVILWPGSGGISCGGSAPSGTVSYYLEIHQGLADPVTSTAYPLYSYGNLWSNVVGNANNFLSGPATLNVWPDADMTGTPLATVDFHITKFP